MCLPCVAFPILHLSRLPALRFIPIPLAGGTIPRRVFLGTSGVGRALVPPPNVGARISFRPQDLHQCKCLGGGAVVSSFGSPYLRCLRLTFFSFGFFFLIPPNGKIIFDWVTVFLQNPQPCSPHHSLLHTDIPLSRGEILRLLPSF